jgi:hypothetical protein
MSDIIEVSSSWLTLRESEDARARSRDLALSASAMLTERPIVVHDLGSGTGSMMRWLAPILPGPQTWILHDWNSSLTGLAVDSERPLAGNGTPVSVGSSTGRLADLTPSDLSGASLVTASALLDILTAREIQAIVRACVLVNVPALLSLSVTGVVSLNPQDPRDDAFSQAFNAHQRRTVQDRPLLGQFGATIARGLFDQAGWRVSEATTSWHLDDHQPQLLSEWFGGWVDAAVEQRPELHDDAVSYRALRASQAEQGALSALVNHTDLLAWPR